MYKSITFLFVLVSFFILSSKAQSKKNTKDQKKETTTQSNVPAYIAKPTENEGLKWYDWNEGYALAVKKNKILIVDIYTDWCGWCKRMDRDTYSKKSIIDMINKDFIAVKFNPEKPNSDYTIEGAKYNNSQLFTMLRNNQSVGYPTTVFLFTDNKKIYLQSGYQDETNFKKILEYYLTLKGQ
jgi:uncharacterized protein YyaL (SSP411 family)